MGTDLGVGTDYGGAGQGRATRKKVGQLELNSIKK